MKEKPVPVPDFVGWKEVGGWDERQALTDDDEVEDILAKSTLLEDYVKDKFYGDWYHNVVLIGMTSIFSWLVARLGGGLPWLVIVLLFTGTFYRTSIRRLRQRYRDDITRELGLKKLETDTETLEWLNSFLVKFWLIYEPVLSETVITIGNQTLKDACPGFIESLSLDTFTLGTKPPRVDHVRTFPKTDEDVAVMDWKFSFTPNDTEDMTARQLKSKVNPKIALGVRVGKGVVSKSLPILVEDMTFSGLMRVRIKMMSTFPHIQTVDVSFLEPPVIDYVLKPVGGDKLGFDINIIPGLSKFIREMIDANAGPMIYAPNAFQLNIEQMLAGAGVDSSIGVLTVRVKNGQELKGSDRLGNTVDPYIKMHIGENTPDLARTSTKSNTRDPVWNETKHLLIKNLNDVLKLEVIDFNDVRKDKLIGIVNFNLETLGTDPDQEGIKGAVSMGGKAKGRVNYDLSFSKILEGRTLDDGTVLPPPECNTGILRITVSSARDLDAKKSLVGQLSTYADVSLNGKSIGQTKTVKKNNSPIWGFSTETLIADKNHSRIAFNVKDARGVSSDPMIGSLNVPLNSIIAGSEKGKEWFDLSPTGQIKLHAVWKPVPIQDLDSNGGYVEPIGMARIGIKRARDLRNLEKIGTIDPYIRVFLGGMMKGRTKAADSTVDPEFDEIVYCPIDSPNQEILIEAMDVEKLGKDRTVGSYNLDPSKFIQTDSSGEFSEYRCNGKEMEGSLSMEGRAPKGKVYFTFDFYPSVNVLSPEQVEERHKKRAEEEAKKKAEEEENKGKKGADKKKKEDDDEDDEEDHEDGANQAEKETGVEMPLEEQLKRQSGVMAVIIEEVSGNPRDTYVRASYDDAAYPVYVTPKLRGSKNKLSESFDFMVRELEYSEIVFQLVTKPSSFDDDDLMGTATISTMKLFRESYFESKTIKITGKGGASTTLSLRTRYFPIDYPLDLSESVLNQGSLRVDVLDAQDLEAADRSGKSDPYAKFYLDGKQIYKTKEVKKTLNPVWNEFFECQIASRSNSKFRIEVYDFDIGPGDDDFLGSNQIDLAKLDPAEPVVLVLNMEGHSGSIRLKVKFTPKYVRTLSAKKTSVFNTVSGSIGTPGKMLMDVGGAPVKVVGNVGGAAAGVVGGAAGGVTKGVKGLFGRGKKEEKGSNHSTPQKGTASADTSANFDASSISSSPSKQHQRGTSISSQTSGQPGNGEITAGQIGLLTLENVQQSAGHVQLRVSLDDKKERDIFKSKSLKVVDTISVDESIPFKSTANGTLNFKLREVHALGRHSDIGEGSLELINTPPGAHYVTIGGAKLAVKLDFQTTN